MLLLLPILAIATALPFAAIQQTPHPLPLEFSISRSFDTDSPFWNLEFFKKLSSKLLSKRYQSASLSNHNNVNYWLDIFLGPGNQKITVSLDTGSSDLWVYGPNVSSSSGGTFDPEAAGSTPLNESFSISYLDGTGAQGDFYKDDFSLSASKGLLKDFQFAVVDQAKFNGPGILGVSSREVETTANKYNNLPFALQKAGITERASYSLYLGSSAGSKGTIIFGGIDKNKYEGELVKYNIPGNDAALALNVVSSSISGNVYNQTTKYLLDSGTSWNLWPEELFQYTVQALNATEENGLYIVECNQPTDKFLEFNFGQNDVKVSYKNLLVEWNGKCLLGAQPGQNTFILGDVFLRSAYVYYDLSNRTISVAQFKDSSTSDIISF
ncbi:hypothetical protein ACI3LY_004558 [Candidozyma auris]|uniref:candidapepsin n=2 Tax=Candidozyma auris TaxID=498019 RepID=A0A2H0ZG38_CANAR|nr:hypothetical_protein [[Candida] auris]KND99527.2 aspartic protease [[Candida] auris]PIS48590.1 hypothetical protein B9J08_005287 [[Candida] auris]PIS49203.1 hypothetical protein CJI97_005371 [[Candida] auris]QEO23181.1 hypothetical_protein [[Candida] auris]QWW24654.1 hypothetical protein CA7LBN_003511 [[Candida] auris]